MVVDKFGRNYVVFVISQLMQIHEIVTQFGLVVISRADRNPVKFIYESDVLSKYKVLYSHIDAVFMW